MSTQSANKYEDIMITLGESTKTQETDPFADQQIQDSQQDRNLKKRYANWFIWILLGQLAIMNIIFFFNGLGILHYNQWALEIYMGGTLAEVFGVVLVITKNLFPIKKH